MQDFLVIPRDSARRVELFSGGSGKSRDMEAFCRKFKGPTDDGYGCHFDAGRWQSRDHHPKAPRLTLRAVAREQLV